MASTYLSRTHGTPTNAYKGTLSYWQKAASTTATNYILACESGSERMLFYLTQGKFQAGLRGTSAPPDIDFTVSGLPRFRDPASFYHVVLAWDSTQSTASDRMKLYVNGVQYTWSGSGTSGVNDVPQNHVMPMNKSGLPFRIGSTIVGGDYFEGIMSHIHFCDGTQYQASDFGEYDANGVWKIKTEPSVTYGNNGFWWLKDTNSATDSSPNSNTPTIGGTLTKTEDNPSNVFATLNPLKSWNDSGTLRQPSYSYGNTRAIFDDAGQNEQAFSTLASSTGKFYCEVKATNVTATENTRIGIGDIDYTGTANPNNQSTTIYYAGSGNKRIGSSSSSYGSSYTNGDIIGVAMDLDNNKLYFSKNGTWQNSGIPTSGSTGTGAIDISDGYNYCFITEDYASSGNRYMDTNFGNGYFGSTQISSAGTNASGNGIFEYDVPTGYTALSTKGLNL